MRILFILFALIFTTSLKAQPRGEDWQDRMSYGGNVGFSFGTETIINISPRVGYYLTDNFMPGVAFTYQYYKRDSFEDKRIGGSAFAKYFISEELFIQAESEMLSTTFYTILPNETVLEDKRWINSTMIGGGYNSGGFTMSAMYIINHDPNTSPYGNSPIVVQGGFMF